jgi:TrmH family RNA methyltransferase
LRRITSKSHSAIVNARKLTQRKHRARQDRLLVEGPRIVALAVRALEDATLRPYIRPERVFCCHDLLSAESQRLVDALAKTNAEVLDVSQDVLDSLSARDHAQGLVATFQTQPLERALSDVLASPGAAQGALLVLDSLQDPGNLGTLIRTADAAGAAGVILLDPCADPFDPKVVRATMGSIFTVPLVRAGAVEPLSVSLRRRGLPRVGTSPSAGDALWQSEALSGPVAIFLGGESQGLRPDLGPHLDAYVRIPMQGHSESLNVAASGAILLYEWCRRRFARALNTEAAGYRATRAPEANSAPSVR